MMPPRPAPAPAPSIPAGAGGADDAALVERARTGERAAFRQLVDRHRDRAYGLALRIVRSPADAEEVAQDAFLRAWLGLPRFRGEASFSTWLYRIVARRAFDRAAVLKRRRARETGVEAAERLASSMGGDEGKKAAVALRLERLIATLSEVQRAVVTMYYLQDRSVDKVAALFEMPENTVKTHLSRARRALREAWLSETEGSNG